MALLVGELKSVLSLDTGSFDRGLSTSESKFKGSAKKLDATSREIAKKAGTGLSVVTVAADKAADGIKKTSIQADRAALAQDKYTAAVKKYGASSLQARTASLSMRTAQENLAKANKKTADSTDDADRSSRGFAKGAGVAGVAVVGAAGAVLAAGARVVDYAGKLDLLKKKSATVFGGELGRVQTWAKENAHAMGLTTTQATGLAAGMADLLIPMGFTRKAAADMATQTTGLAGALAEWSGGTKTAAEVTDTLQAAFMGERDGLNSLGISITQAEVDAELLAKGQQNLTGKQLQQAEATATQKLIMEKSTDAQKAYADGADSLARKTAESKARLAEWGQTIVTKATPVLVGLVSIITDDALPALDKFATKLAGGGDGSTRFADALRYADGPLADKARQLFGVQKGLGVLNDAMDASKKIVEGYRAAQEKSTATMALFRQGERDATNALGAAQEATKKAIPTAAELAATYVRQWQATQKQNEELTRNSNLLLTLSGAEIAYQEAVDAASASVKENGRTHDINTAKGRANKAALDQVAESANAQTVAMRNAGDGNVSAAKHGETARQNFIKLATQMGYNKTEAAKMAQSMIDIPNVTRTAKLQANKKDLETKLAAAKRELDNPKGVTKTRQTELKAKIAQLEAAIKTAQGKINGLKGKTVPVEVKFTSLGYTLALGQATKKQKFAAGGPVYGGERGKDSVPALLMPDEHVWTTQETAAVGGHGAMKRIRQAALAGELRGFARGGSPRASLDSLLGRVVNANVTRLKVNFGPDGGPPGRAQRYRGVMLNTRTIRMLNMAERALGALFHITQGSYSTRVAASGSTHAGGGAMDTNGPRGWNAAVAALRKAGFAAWHRTPSQGPWNHHIHSIAIGDPTASPAAKRQVQSYLRGGNGLGGYEHGTAYVPRDGLAYLHQGERVVTADQNSGKDPMTVQLCDEDRRRLDRIAEATRAAGDRPVHAYLDGRRVDHELSRHALGRGY